MKSFRSAGLWLLGTTLCVALSGCSTLLPEGKRETVVGWQSYDEAAKALAAIEPYKATRADVHREGLDPVANPAVTVLHFTDVLQRLSTAPLLKQEDLDPGIRDCLRAGKRCSGYAISVRKVSAHRVGNFFLDFLNFKRETLSDGWSVEALMVFVDDKLVYELTGGQPTIEDYQLERNPLGPFQGLGTSLPSVIH